MTPTSPTTRSANWSRTKCAGGTLPFQRTTGRGRDAQTRQFLTPPRLSVPPAPAKVPAAPPSALTRVATRSAERSRSARTRACATAWAPSAPPPSPRPTSPPATERRKSASTGWEAGVPLRLPRPVAIVTRGCQSSRVPLLPRRAAPAPSVRSTGSRRAPVRARMARMRQSSVTCAAWRRVSHLISFTSLCSPEQRFSR